MKATDWTPIEDGVPNDYDLCLVRTKFGFFVTRYYEDDGTFREGGHTLHWGVTHWMKIIKPEGY